MEKTSKILFITQDDPFYVRLFFEEFFRHSASIGEVKGVVIVQAMGKKSLSALARQMYCFYGPFNFLRVGLNYAGYKIMAKLAALLGGTSRFSISGLCRLYGIPVLSTSNVNSKEFLESIRPLELDLIVSVAAPVIFKEDLIGTAKLGCINIHNGMLPRYRGMLPNFWQMYHGEHEVGITVHEINKKLDDGRIILQEKVPIETGETLDKLIRRTKRLGAQVMIRALEAIRTETVEYLENSAEAGSYFSFPTRQDVVEFQRRGHRII
jgi:methionyl-tRNA formyltransferase